MHQKASECIRMFRMLQNASECLRMLQDASDCFRMLQNASEGFRMHQNASECSECIRMLQNASECFRLLQNASECIRRLQNALEFFRMLQNLIEGFRISSAIEPTCSRIRNVPKRPLMYCVHGEKNAQNMAVIANAVGAAKNAQNMAVIASAHKYFGRWAQATRAAHSSIYVGTNVWVLSVLERKLPELRRSLASRGSLEGDTLRTDIRVGTCNKTILNTHRTPNFSCFSHRYCVNECI